MRIDCPYCGARDQAEFAYLGDAAPRRPTTAMAAETPDQTQAQIQAQIQAQALAQSGAMFDYVYIRDNPAGRHRELWYHAFGCRAWLEVSRDVRTHAIFHVLAVNAPAEAATTQGGAR